MLTREKPFSCPSAEDQYCLRSLHLRTLWSIALNWGNFPSQQTTGSSAVSNGSRETLGLPSSCHELLASKHGQHIAHTALKLAALIE